MVESQEGARSLECANCHASNAPDTAFCTQCGAPLANAPEAAPSAARSRRAQRGDAVEQARARNEFARIKGIVLTVRSVFWAEFLYAVVLALFWHVMLAEVEPEDRADGATWVTVLVWAQAALMAAGALLVMRAPLVWTTVGACASTLYVTIAIWSLDFEVPPALLFQAFLVLAFWFAVAQAARVQKLMAADPSLQIVRKRIDPTRKVQGGVADAAKARRREEGRGRLLGRLKLAGLVLVLLVVAIFVVREITRPPTVDATVADFAARWGRSEVEPIVAMLEAAGDDRHAKDLREEIERRGWLTALPGVGNPEVETYGERAIARWKVGEDRLSANFQLFPAGWHLVGVSLPPIQAPDAATAFDAFRAAWAAKGTDALLAMVREASRERFGKSMVRLLEKRQWHEERPPLGDIDPGRPGLGRASVLFGMGTDELQVQFEYWHPSWRVSGIRLPRE